jgi:hypothetical protein
MSFYAGEEKLIEIEDRLWRELNILMELAQEERARRGGHTDLISYLQDAQKHIQWAMLDIKRIVTYDIPNMFDVWDADEVPPESPQPRISAFRRLLNLLPWV